MSFGFLGFRDSYIFVCMNILRHKLKLVLLSFFIFMIQLLVWIPFEFLRDDYSEAFFLSWVTINLLVYYLSFTFIQRKLKITDLGNIILLSSVQLGLSLFVILGSGTAKIRSVDLIFYTVFIISNYFIVRKTRRNILFQGTLILGLTGISYLFYHTIGLHLLSFYFYEQEYTQISDRHQPFYLINHDSTKVLYPFKQKGKVYFIEFWNKNCPACIKNLPNVERLQSYYKDDTLVKIISSYYPVYVTDTRPWFYNTYLTAKENFPKMNYYYINLSTTQKFHINTFPHFFLIDKNGKGIEGTHVSFDKEFSKNIYERIELLKNL